MQHPQNTVSNCYIPLTALRQLLSFLDASIGQGYFGMHSRIDAMV